MNNVNRKYLILKVATFLIALLPLGPILLAYNAGMVCYAHCFVHMVIGTIGMIAAFNIYSARLYCQFATIFFIFMMVAGFTCGGNFYFVNLNLCFPDTMAHATFAAISGYFGFFLKLPTKVNQAFIG